MKPFNVNSQLSPHLKGLTPYVPGAQPQTDGWIKLNTNELPYPASPRVGPAIKREFEKLTLYPDPLSSKLRKAIEEKEKLPAGSVIIGNGSDDLLNLLARLYGGLEQEVVESFPSYSLYTVLVAISGGQLASVPFEEDFKLPIEALVKTSGSILFLTSPNAPSGVSFDLAEVDSLCDQFNGIVVVDEAYVDFAPHSMRPLLDRHENLVITRTFSKSFGLAGLRVGYAMASPAIISLIDSIRDSYNVNRLSQAGALAAYLDSTYYKEVIGKVKATRESFQQSLTAFGWFYYSSSTNFVFVRPARTDGDSGPEVAKSLFDFFSEHKILIRHFPNHPLTESFLRISIGTDLQMSRVLELIEKWQKSEQQV